MQSENTIFSTLLLRKRLRKETCPGSTKVIMQPCPQPGNRNILSISFYQNLFLPFYIFFMIPSPPKEFP